MSLHQSLFRKKCITDVDNIGVFFNLANEKSVTTTLSGENSVKNQNMRKIKMSFTLTSVAVVLFTTTTIPGGL